MTSTSTMAARTTDENAVREVLKGTYTAWAAGDADAFVAHYREDATVVRPGTYITGRDGIRAYLVAGFAGPLKGSRAFDEPVNIRFLGDDVAVVVSDAGILMGDETELPAERRRRATCVLSRQGAEWQVAAYHNSPAS